MVKKNEKAVNEFNQVMKPVSLWADAWKRLKKNKMALISLWIVAFYALAALAAPILPLHDYRDQAMNHINLPPSFKPAGQLSIDQLEAQVVVLKQRVSEGVDSLKPNLERAEADLLSMKANLETDPVNKYVYILGTDYLGRDMLAKTIYGARISMMVGLIGTLTAVLVGVIIGAISGYIGGWLDNLLMRFVDIMYGLPYMLIVIILMAMFRKEGQSSIVILFIGIALVSWLTIARVVRGQIISLKNSEFVEAARSMGAGPGRIIFRHLLPNALGVIIVFTSLSLPSFIMSESFLSFLGMGVSAPLSSWGSLVAEGANTMELYPWQLLAPAIEMTLFLFCMNFVGDGLRDALDPQSKNRT
ncbi:MAG: ABC transporter permease [Spirochaetes bacterium]|nr:ABC transporter permease [Spirochaetota bacterium]